MRRLALVTLLSAAAVSIPLLAQQPAPKPTTAADAPQRNSSFIDSEGRAHITRIIPVPKDLSRQSQFWLSEPVPDAGPPESLEHRRSSTDAWAVTARDQWLQLYPGKITEDKIAGVPVRLVVPDGMPDANQDKVLLNLHGGGFNSDSGSYTESIPMAGMTQIKCRRRPLPPRPRVPIPRRARRLHRRL